ncbi:MAG: hypothetical protein QM770_03850 [Tepidisphaeraceae bacterium]
MNSGATNPVAIGNSSTVTGPFAMDPGIGPSAYTEVVKAARAALASVAARRVFVRLMIFLSFAQI